MSIRIHVNGHDFAVASNPDTPLLWVLRDELNLKGTRFGCGMAQCGACTVHVDGQPIRACVTPAGSLGAAKVTTIEGLGGEHVLQTAWIRHNVPQCGYCQSGQIMSAVALLAGNPQPTDNEIDAAMSGNICRCGTYQRIRAAIKDASRAA